MASSSSSSAATSSSLAREPVRFFVGDVCVRVAALADSSIDCIVTSPPYAEQRKRKYAGIAEDNYASWTVEWMRAVMPKLKPHASVAIVIRPHIKSGQISDYVLRTRLALRDDGWRECEELIWIKPDSAPMGSTERPRRSWESVLWFSRAPKPFCNTRFGGSTSSRAYDFGALTARGHGDYVHAGHSTETAGVSRPRRSRDYLEAYAANGVDRDPRNTHPAQFPEALSTWLVGLLCKPADSGASAAVVLDPFCGSGTTGVSARKLGHHFVGIDKSAAYVEYATVRVARAIP